ncbi:MAG: hypothetical protein OSJ27_08460 [Candidatus Gastranaerophilales bacterium]|nr:hypothetical protein [Candidatus Gastranaerophilales bacterium]
MIMPITSNQAIAAATRVTNPVTFGRRSVSAYENQINRFEKGEKLNINCCGTREHSVCGQKINYLA